jgi:hypothetical protein
MNADGGLVPGRHPLALRRLGRQAGLLVDFPSQQIAHRAIPEIRRSRCPMLLDIRWRLTSCGSK